MTTTSMTNICRNFEKTPPKNPKQNKKLKRNQKRKQTARFQVTSQADNPSKSLYGLLSVYHLLNWKKKKNHFPGKGLWFLFL